MASPTDTLSRVLAACRSERASTARFELSAPWSLHSRGVEGLLIRLGVGATCWLTPDGEAPVPLHSGDIALLPHGGAHTVGSDPTLPATPFSELLQRHQQGRHGDHPITFAHGGGGAATALYSLHVWVPAAALRPLLLPLPSLIVLRQGDAPAHALLALAMQGLVDETLLQRPGWQLGAARLSDLLLVHLLQQHLLSAPAGQATWWQGLADVRIATALERLHEAPGQRWTLDTLARASGLSRTVLSDRFTALMGCPPMDYLARHRMAVAAQLLRERRQSLWQVAEAVGYGSDKAFARAFERHMGLTPTAYQRQHAG